MRPMGNDFGGKGKFGAMKAGGGAASPGAAGVAGSSNGGMS